MNHLLDLFFFIRFQIVLNHSQNTYSSIWSVNSNFIKFHSRTSAQRFNLEFQARISVLNISIEIQSRTLAQKFNLEVLI